jgi:Flagellin-specific chaperone FliS
MAINQALESYKQSENDYVKGINSPHGRITILFDTILSNLEKLIDNHPKTDFISLGKCINGITILSGSLNLKEGGEIAQNLVELYEYCRKNINNYLEDKKIEKLEEVHSIFSKLSDGWQGISPDKKNI